MLADLTICTKIGVNSPYKIYINDTFSIQKILLKTGYYEIKGFVWNDGYKKGLNTALSDLLCMDHTNWYLDFLMEEAHWEAGPLPIGIIGLGCLTSKKKPNISQKKVIVRGKKRGV